MRYFDTTILANSRHHQGWWDELIANREWFHRTEETLAQVFNAAVQLPREAWMELDDITRRVMRTDEGQAYMADLLPLAKTVNIGKLVHMTRVASDSANPVIRSMSGQVPVPLDKVVYDYRGTPIPVFQDGYGREWREWKTLESENFDALSDDQEAANAKLRRDMAQFVLKGDPNIVFQGYQAYGIQNHPLTKTINLGSGAGGANIDLTSADWPAIDAFINGAFGAMLDANLVAVPVNVYISPEIARNLDRQVNTSAGITLGSRLEQLQKNRRINKIVVSYELTGNQFFGFVPSADYIRPLIGMAVNTTAKTRQNPTDNYQFMVMGAMGLEIRGDYNGKSGVFASVVVN